jgi:hypothetical protein
LYVPELLLVAVKAVPVHEASRRRQLLRSEGPAGDGSSAEMI